MRKLATLVAVCLAVPTVAQSQNQASDHSAIINAVLEKHILPGFADLSDKTAALAGAAGQDCAPTSEPLRAAYNGAFDSWMEVSHLRFGPTEVDNLAFGLAFWPDTRGATPKSLAEMIRSEDPVVDDAAAFTTVSVAARGFYAMEYLLYGDDLSSAGAPDYHCQLVRAVATDIHASSAAILTDWQSRYSDILRNQPAEPYRSEEEVIKELYKALTAGLEFTADTRLGRPLGTFERPRPNRAEARRSERSLRNVLLSVQALGRLAALLSEGRHPVQDEVDIMFERATLEAERLDDPTFVGVGTAQGHIRVESLQTAINRVREVVTIKLGPVLGVSAGFNSLDGD